MLMDMLMSMLIEQMLMVIEQMSMVIEQMLIIERMAIIQIACTRI